MRGSSGNLLALAIGCAVAIAGVEVYFRLADPYAGLRAAREYRDARTTQRETWSSVFVPDPDLGYRPKLDGPWYTAYGTLPNGYDPEDRRGRTRLLFAGDSVTQRGFIVEALRQRLGERHYEYWNAGVEGYSTVQEVRFYELFNAALEPDHVILTFHLNDFETTPIVFRNRQGDAVVFAPNQPLRRISPWLFRRSYVYRLLVGLTSRGRARRQGILDETGRSLERWRDRLQADDACFTVLLLPILRPLDEWKDYQREYRQAALEIFDDLELRFFDLLPPLQEALAAGLPVSQTPADEWHPGKEVSSVFARYLEERGLLSGDGCAATAGG